MHGQTSSPVVETSIQTGCNFEANLRDGYYHLDCFHCLYGNAILESPNQLMVLDYSYTILSSNLDPILHKDFLHPPSSSKSSTRPCSTTEPNKSTEHSAIQKGIEQCNMATTDAGRLLFSLFCSFDFVDYQGSIFICLSGFDLFNHFSLPKLIIKPDSLLLETSSSQTSSEGHNQTSA